jgi:hypothetical protein
MIDTTRLISSGPNAGRVRPRHSVFYSRHDVDGRYFAEVHDDPQEDPVYTTGLHDSKDSALADARRWMESQK